MAASMLRSLFRSILGRLPDGAAARLHYAAHHRRWPNVAAPRRFSEKVLRRKLRARDPRMAALADKVVAKQIVAEAIGAEHVIPTLWSGPALPPRDARDWPPPFVIKTNNGSGTNLFVRTAADRDWDRIEATVAGWLGDMHGGWAGEWLYRAIPPQILIEPFIGDDGVLPMDYKLFVFAGRVHVIEVDTDRASTQKRTFFDRDWMRQDFGLGYPRDERPIDRPQSLPQMIEFAERLGRDFGFARVDFYDRAGTALFGEVTFYPDSGKAAFSPDAMDFRMGALWPDA